MSDPTDSQEDPTVPTLLSARPEGSRRPIVMATVNDETEMAQPTPTYSPQKSRDKRKGRTPSPPRHAPDIQNKIDEMDRAITPPPRESITMPGGGRRTPDAEHPAGTMTCISGATTTYRPRPKKTRYNEDKKKEECAEGAGDLRWTPTDTQETYTPTTYSEKNPRRYPYTPKKKEMASSPQKDGQSPKEDLKTQRRKSEIEQRKRRPSIIVNDSGKDNDVFKYIDSDVVVGK